MIPLNPWVLLGAAVAAGVIAGGSFAYGLRVARLECKAAEADRRELVAEVRSANLALARGISKDTETAIGKIRVTNTTINNEVRHEREIHRVLDNPDCAIPESTVRLLNRARGHERGDDRPGAGEPDRGVPGPRAVTRSEDPAR